MLLNDKQNHFIRSYYLENKTISEIASETGISEETLKEWRISLSPEVGKILAEETDHLLRAHQLTYHQRLRYLSELYSRLRSELDKRDFTGLPTDKLFLMLNDVQMKINNMLSYDDDDDDYDYDDWEDFEDDEYIP